MAPPLDRAAGAGAGRHPAHPQTLEPDWQEAGKLWLADSIGTLFRLFPMPVLGVILFFGGLELASSVAGDRSSQAERTVLVVTAGVALWNMRVAYLAGLALYHAWRRGVITLSSANGS